MTRQKVQNNIPQFHPFEPFLSPTSRLLMLGSFPPPPRRWVMDFYYPNWNNDMWRIMGMAFYGDKNHFLDLDHKTFLKADITEFLHNKHIAMYDMATCVKRLRNNASDQFLEVVQATDIAALLRKLPLCAAIVTTGGKATDTLLLQLPMPKPPVGGYTDFVFGNRALKLYRMPSSSRAYPLAFDKKTYCYKVMFEQVGLL